jgi:hypothetical protein
VVHRNFRRAVVGGLVALALVVALVGYSGDHRSSGRNAAVREAEQSKAVISDRMSRTWSRIARELARRVRLLDCGGLLPDAR